MKRPIGYALIALLILLTLTFIFGSSAKPSAESNSDSNQVLDKVENVVDPLLQGITGQKPQREEMHKLVRKAAHFAEYALLGIELTVLVLYHKRRLISELLFMPPFALLFAAMTDELIQAATDRTSSVGDVCLDFCGGVAGMIMALTAAWLLPRLIAAGKKARKENPS